MKMYLKYTVSLADEKFEGLYSRSYTIVYYLYI